MRKVFNDPGLQSHFDINGYVILNNFLNSKEVDDLKALYNSTTHNMGEVSFATTLMSRSSECKRTGSEGIRNVFIDKTAPLLDNYKWFFGSYLVKDPGINLQKSGIVPLHQDASMLDETKGPCLNIWCPLVDTNEANGTLQIIPGSHHFNKQPRGFSIDFPYAHLDTELRKHLLSLNLKAGQAIVYATPLFHASQPNTAAHARLVASGVLGPVECAMQHYHYDLRGGQPIEVFEVDENYYFDSQMFSRPDPERYPLLCTIENTSDELTVDRIRQSTQHQKNEQKELRIEIPESRNAWQSLAIDGAIHLIKQFPSGFEEAAHHMYFPTSQGFTSPDEWQTGDIFQRAIICDTLIDLKQLVPAMSILIEEEQKYLAGCMRKDECGWAYFPGLAELPPDADDLAQVMLACLRDNRETYAPLFAQPVQNLLNNNLLTDGGINTWLIHGSSPNAPLQHAWVAEAWGAGVDVEVVANMLYALHISDPSVHCAVIDQGNNFLLKQMNPDGSWKSSWYTGSYYGTYMVLRILATRKVVSAPLSTIVNFLKSTRNADGGWGVGEQSDPLQTALALLCINELCIINPQWQQELQPEAAINFLQSTCLPDGGWPACSFIRMELGRAKGNVLQVLEYESRCITTAFVCKATTRMSDMLETITQHTSITSSSSV